MQLSANGRELLYRVPKGRLALPTLRAMVKYKAELLRIIGGAREGKWVRCHSKFEHETVDSEHPSYNLNELSLLLGSALSLDHLKAIDNVKQVFPSSELVEI